MLIFKSLRLPRRIPLRLFTTALAFSLTLTSPLSFSKGVDLHVEMQPIRTLQTSFAVPGITLRVPAPSVYQIAVTSELSQGEVILETRSLAEAYKIDPESLRASAGLIEFRVPHERYLKEGVYAQQINITIWDSELDIPVVQPLFRYFQATATGVMPISAEEYSRVVEPPITFIDLSGRKTLEYNGSRLGRKLKLDEKPGLDRQEFSESVAGNRDDSEKNEP
jgi:hypothetical protein